MRITALRTFIVPPRWLFLKVETDEGIVGWGQPVLEGHAETLATKIAELGDLVIGLDPRKVEDIWQLLYRNGCYRGGPVLMSAISGLDMALWDIKGRALGVPVHALLGGPVRERIRSHCWIGGDRPSDLVEGALALRERGYDACKFNVCSELQIVDTYAKVDAIIHRLTELREAVGPAWILPLTSTAVCTPQWHACCYASSSRCAQCSLRTQWYRPWSRPWPTWRVPPRSPCASASGSTADMTSSGSSSCAQRRSSTRTRRTEMVRIGHWAEAYDVALAPHCPVGPIALAACLQVDAVCHNDFIQEQSLGIHYNEGGDLGDYLLPGHGMTLEDGHLLIPKGPGLGIEVDEQTVARAAEVGHRWRAPVWRHKDGSIAEW